MYAGWLYTVCCRAVSTRYWTSCISVASLCDVGSVVGAARELCGQDVDWVVVSLCPDGAVAVSSERAVRARAPRVDALNPVGCGDVLVAGLASGLATGLEIPAALPDAVRVATASAAHPGTGAFDPSFAETLRVSSEPV